MQDIIKLLPDSVANQIAAGEVIRRPANVVKELVENAIDAGATEVQVIIKDAGRTLVQIVDNGCGMSPTDARMAFERHSTSKIAQAADMFALHTMGFRGEALASIAAIAQIDMRSMRHDDTIGTRILINGSRVESQQPEACQPGTNIMVKNLFFNVPARRKFLRKDASEMAQIMQVFQQMALVNPGVRLTLVSNDKPHTALPPAVFRQRITDIFGANVGKQLMPLATDTSIVKIDGYVSAPQYARRRNNLQYLMVNGRHMRHPYFHKAIMRCYEGMIKPEEVPTYFLRLTVDPATIDVNVHPQKEEIKFENEQAIWQILTAAVREAIGRYSAGGDIDFDSTDAPDIPIYNPDVTLDMPTTSIDPTYNPFNTAPKTTVPSQRLGTKAPSNWQQLYEEFSKAAPPSTDEGTDEDPTLLPSDDVSPHTLGLRDRYILAPCRSGLMVVDQHRAHIRVLYDQLLTQMQTGPLASQKAIFPDLITLSEVQTLSLQQCLEQLTQAGFDLSYLGDNSWSVNAVPAVAAAVNPERLLSSLADAFGSEDASAHLAHLTALAMARQGATPSGQHLTTEQMEHLLEQLLLCPTPNYTPDGQLIISIIPAQTIAAPFN